MDFSSVCVEAMPSITTCSFVMRVSQASQISPSAGPPQNLGMRLYGSRRSLGLRPALHRGGVQGLLLQPLAQRAVGLQADHAVELRPVARDQAYPADHHVVDPPASVAHVEAVVERDLRAPPGHHLRAHGGEVPLDRLADEADPLAAARLDLRHVGALQEVPKERHELRLLLRRQRLPMLRERAPRDLVEVEYLTGDPPDLPRPVGHGSAGGLAVLDDAQERTTAASTASRGPTAGEATADSTTSSHATEIAIPIHVVVIIVLRETNARPSSRARQSSECLIGLREKP